MENEKKYSQNDEQFVIARQLQKFGISEGRLLDIGAYTPVEFSNTRSLIDKGWSGVLIEPSPGPFQALLAHYGTNPNIDLVNAAVGTCAGMIDFYDSGGDAISTTSVAHMTKWQQGWKVAYRKFLVYTLPVAELFRRFGPRFEFINLDVEDTNWQIFDALPFLTLTQTRIVCVEHDNQIDRMVEKVKPYGFEAIHHNGENLILAR